MRLACQAVKEGPVRPHKDSGMRGKDQPALVKASTDRRSGKFSAPLGVKHLLAGGEIEKAKQPFLPFAPGQGQDPICNVQKPGPPQAQRGFGAAEGQHRPVMFQHRSRFTLLPCDMPRSLFRLDRQPWRAAGEPAIRRCVPDHRRSGVVTAHGFRPEGDALRISQLFQCQFGIGLAKFLAFPQADRAFERQQKRGRLFCQRVAVIAGFGPSGDVAGNVMV